MLGSREVAKLARAEAVPRLPPPARDSRALAFQAHGWSRKAMRIAYGDQVVIDGLDWTIAEGTGSWWDRTGLASRPCSPSSPEITRKVTTMSSICSGRRRGSGRNIWEIKRHIEH